MEETDGIDHASRHLEIAEKQVLEASRQLDEQNAVIQKLKHNHLPTDDALAACCREESVRIATYNINNVNKRLPVLLSWLEETKSDVVCLKELKCEQGSFPKAEIEAAGYHAAWVGQRSWNGVAILARGTAPAGTRLDVLDGEEREEGEADLKRQKRSWHSALMALGRNKLTREPLSPPADKQLASTHGA